MSLKQQINIKCPKCNEESEFTVWKNVNTVLDPDLKEKVRSGEIFRFTCPHCEQITSFDYDMLYNQDEDKLMIYYATSEQSFVEALHKLVGNNITQAGNDLDDVTVRVVDSRYAFKEKLVIFENGFDDRTIEIVKLILSQKFMKEHKDEKFDYILFDKQGEKFGFIVISNNQPMGFFPMSVDMYEKVDADYRRYYPVNKKDNLDISFGWALNKVKNVSDDI